MLRIRLSGTRGSTSALRQFGVVSERLPVPITVCDSHDFRCQDEDRNSEASGFAEILIRGVRKG